MSALPVVSIIVPCYNQAEFLPDALDSVLSQTYTDWECIIVNDGSLDNTEEVASFYRKKDTRIHYLKKENGGLSSARNAGINTCNGTYILPLDADDLIDPDYISEAVKYFTENTGTKLVYCKLKKFGAENGIKNLRPFSYPDLLIDNMIFCSAIFKKSDFLQVSGYDESMKLGLEDWELWIRLLDEKSHVKQLQEPYFFYRIKKNSMNIELRNYVDDIKYYIYYKHIEKYKKYFNNPISAIQEIERLKAVYKNSKDYKLGNFIINPARIVFNTLKKLNKTS